MYNRYIPQPDGSYRRSRVPDTQPTAPVRQYVPECETVPDPVCEQSPECKPCQDRKGKPCSQYRPRPPHAPPRRQEYPLRPPSCEPKRDSQGTVGSFLRGLIPKGFDTADLLIVLLLLLMAGDCQEDQNSALLTLALYFIM